MQKEIYPIAKLADLVLVISKKDAETIKETKKLENIQSVKVDPTNKEVYDPIPLENHLKFNPWEEIVDDQERTQYLIALSNTFPERVLDSIVDSLQKAKNI